METPKEQNKEQEVKQEQTQEQVQKTVKTKENKPKKKSKTRMILVLLFIAVVAIIGYVMFRGSYLEIVEIGQNYVEAFWTTLIYKGIVFAINFVVLFVFIYFTTRGIKKGLKSFFEQEKKVMPRLPNKSVSFVLAVVVSGLMMNFITDKAMLMFNNAWFGMNDPIFNLDIGYFMFQKPFIEFIILYFTAILVGLAIYVAIYYIAVFNICFDTGIDRQTLRKSRLLTQITRILKVVAIGIAAIVIVNTQNIVLEKFVTLKDENSTALYGAGMTDVTIKLWGYRLLALVIVASIFMAIKYFKNRSTKKVIISLLCVPAYLVILFIVMAGFQLIFVNPNQLDKEKEYIAYNIENTKNAYQINIEEKDMENSETLSLEQMKQNEEVLNNISIVSKDVTLTTLQDKQSSSKYYSFRDTQIGNYNINGKNQLVYVSPREIVSGNNVTYNNKTYEYTHGMGSVISSAVSTDKTGNLNYIQKSFDGSDNKIKVDQSRIYFGMDTNEPVVTNSKNKTEFDYPTSESSNAETTYQGTAGLKLGFFDRLVLGIRQGNMKLAFSGDVTDDSKILINRNILKRAEKIMPNVMYDESPYQVVTDEGRLVWVIDGYTTSNAYPYSQSTVIERNGTRQRINYIRNSVKVVIDSYDGSVHFYITDRTDPIIMAYRNVYPTLFESVDTTLPEDIQKHVVYPEFLYNIQAKVLERYHNVKTDVLYRSNDVWERATHTTSKTLKTKGTAIDPYYTMVKTNEQAQLGLVLPYTPFEKQNLISYLVGTVGDNGNGRLTLYKYSSDSSVLGPMQLDTQIEQDAEISKAIQALNVTGTKLIREMIIVPIENSLLYIEPIYQVMLNESEVPVLKKIIVASGNKVAMGDNLTEALSNLSSQATKIEVSNTDNLKDLMNAIVKANQDLDKSKASANLEMIGKDTTNIQELIKKLELLLEEQEKEAKANGKNGVSNTTTNTVGENTTENEVNSVQ